MHIYTSIHVFISIFINIITLYLYINVYIYIYLYIYIYSFVWLQIYIYIHIWWTTISMSKHDLNVLESSGILWKAISFINSQYLNIIRLAKCDNVALIYIVRVLPLNWQGPQHNSNNIGSTFHWPHNSISRSSAYWEVLSALAAYTNTLHQESTSKEMHECVWICACVRVRMCGCVWVRVCVCVYVC